MGFFEPYWKPTVQEDLEDHLHADKIHSACPTLKKSRNLNLTENNIYIDFYIFEVLFEKVSRKESAITLNVISSRNTWVLMYQNS
jgi:hypothetical protein